MPDKDRPLLSANITRLRVLYRECKTDAAILEEIRDELRRRRTASAKELLRTIERELDGLASKQLKLMNEKEEGPDDGLHYDDDKDKIKKRHYVF